MWLTLDDLRCAQCGAYVHPLLDGCPACGAPRSSRRRDAETGPIGAVRLAESPETQRSARNISMRYTMKVNSIGSSHADATLGDAVAHLVDALTYRVAGDGLPGADNASLTLRDGALVAQVRPSGALLAELPLRAIVGTSTRHGEASIHYAASLAAGPRSAAYDDADPRRMTIANRGGLLASRARDDHFDSLACWLAVLATAEAERHWTEVGLRAYLAELGPAAGGAAPAADSASIDATADSAAPPTRSVPAPSIQASLVELESLRTAGLVADDEYAAKRREILARL